MPCSEEESAGLFNGQCDGGPNAVFHLDEHDAMPSSSNGVSEQQNGISCASDGSYPDSVAVEGAAATSTKAEGNADANVNVNGVRERTPSTRSTITASPTSSFSALSPLPGEEFTEDCWVDLCRCRLFLTKYRLLIVLFDQSSALSVPLLSVESVEAKDIVWLHVICKDGKVIRLRAENADTALQWFKRLAQATCVPRNVDDVFAFKFHSKTATTNKSPTSTWLRRHTSPSSSSNRMNLQNYYALKREFKRLELADSSWKISTQNENFEVCSTYPQYLIIPASVSSEDLGQMKHGRFYNRLPTIAWRSRNGSVLARSSQPTIGFFGMTNEHDVRLYEKFRLAAGSATAGRFLIVDARSYTAAWANRAKGGGFESVESYAGSEVIFTGLPNIHNIRYSFHQLRQLLNSTGDQNSSTYLQSLQNTLWFQNMGHLFAATERCLRALCVEGTNVLVHCSDGWDRTTQIVCLCMLMADQYYRTFEGFQFLIQRQWIEFGHKFADRSGTLNGDENERSPVFLQFLDCVYQLWTKNPDSFEFNRRYLMKLAQHTYSGLFGSFLFNSVREAARAGCAQLGSHTAVESNSNGGLSNGERQGRDRCYSIWDYLGRNNFEFVNPAYEGRCRSNFRIAAQPHIPTKASPADGLSCSPTTADQLLSYPKTMAEFELWRDVYCCTPAQCVINNPDAQLPYASSLTSVTASPNAAPHPLASAGSTGSIHDISADKATNLSRSQSATSLTSLEKNTLQSLYNSGHLDPNGGQHHPILASSPTASCNGHTMSASVHHLPSSEATGDCSAANTAKTTNWQNKKFLDVDGLSKVPIVFEDRCVEIFRELLQLEQQMSRTADAPAHYHPPLGFHYHHLNGLIKVNGQLENSVVTRRIRNESIDSTTFEVIDEFSDEHQHPSSPCVTIVKRKHDSSGTNSSTSSTFTSVVGSEGHSSMCMGCRTASKNRICSVGSLKELEEDGTNDHHEQELEQEACRKLQEDSSLEHSLEQRCNGKQQTVAG